jgi:hypothetical protein
MPRFLGVAPRAIFFLLLTLATTTAAAAAAAAAEAVTAAPVFDIERHLTLHFLLPSRHFAFFVPYFRHILFHLFDNGAKRSRYFRFSPSRLTSPPPSFTLSHIAKCSVN